MMTKIKDFSGLLFYQIKQPSMSLIMSISTTLKPGHVVTSIKQSPVLKGHLFLVLS
jgi:hypothetical protein